MNAPSDKEIDQLVSTYGADFTPDVEAGLRRLRGQINTDVSGAPGRRSRQRATVRPLRRRWLAAAAAVLVLVFAGFFILNQQEEVIFNASAAPLAAELPDGTRLLLQEGAEVRYQDDFNDKDRRIELAGQAYFEITHDTDRPFLVANEETELRVTGTAFNLRMNDGELEVEVAEGSVELHQKKSKLAVGPKQCGLAKAGKQAMLMPAPHLNRHAWRTGKLHFENAPMHAVLTTIRNNFGVKINGGEDCTVKVSATYRAQDPAAILQDLVKLGGGQLIIEDGNFSLKNFCK